MLTGLGPHVLVQVPCKTPLSFMLLLSSVEKAVRQRSRVSEFNGAQKIPVLHFMTAATDQPERVMHGRMC